MTKKSIIGIVLLSCMVLVKAFLIDKTEVSELLVREGSVLSVNNDDQLLRDETPSQLNSLLAGLVKNLSAEDIKFHQPSQQERTTADYGSNNEFLAVVDHVENQAERSSNNEHVAVNSEEIIPMDYVSNTGYGLLVSDLSMPSGTSESELPGNVPLDRGSTITESISKLFPRTPH